MKLFFTLFSFMSGFDFIRVDVSRVDVASSIYVYLAVVDKYVFIFNLKFIRSDMIVFSLSFPQYEVRFSRILYKSRISRTLKTRIVIIVFVVRKKQK